MEPDLTPASPEQLYLVEIGGMRDGSLFECHEMHAVFAPDEATLIATCRTRFAGAMHAAHLDGWLCFALAPAGAEPPAQRHYAIELGRNSRAAVREEHAYRFLGAASWKDAAVEARRLAPGWHVDAVIDLDELALGQGCVLARDLLGAVPEPQHVARYLRFT